MRELTERYDVVVCGGGLAGLVSAVAAARTGAERGLRVALVEERPSLGGNSSSLAGVPPHGATGIGHNRDAREGGILEELRMAYAARSPLADNRQLWDRTLRDFCAREPNLGVFMNTRVTEVFAQGGEIRAVGALQTTTETRLRLEGKVFVEATGDASVAMRAGARVRMGREARSEYGESLALPEADAKTLGSTIYITALRRDYPVDFEAPPGTKAYADCARLEGRGHAVADMLASNALAPDAGAFRVFWWLELGGERSVIDDAEAIYEDLVGEMFAVWDHLKNRCTGDVRRALRNYDLAAWSLYPLKRGSRRVVGAHVLSEGELFEPPLHEDRIAYGGFPIDLHPPEGIRSAEAPCEQTFLNELYSVPYRSLYCDEVRNLFLAGRCVSASHVAMGSIRVMYTLGSLGQAAGTAAAICAAEGIGARELGGPRIHELQQRLLRDDHYIIALKNEDTGDFARLARPEATSDMPALAGAPDGFMELALDTAQAFPLGAGPVGALSAYLRNSGSSLAEPRWAILLGGRLGRADEATLVSEGRLRLEPGSEGWRTVSPGIPAPAAGLLWLRMEACPGVQWAWSGRELPGTRFAVRWEGSMATGAVHGKAFSAPRAGSWISANHHGRLPTALDETLARAMGGAAKTRYHALAPKPYVTLAVGFDPPLRPYSAANALNGTSRSTDSPNLWISDPALALPQGLSLYLDRPRPVSEIVIVFDTSLDCEDRVYGFPRGNFRFPYPVPECARDYSVLLRKPGEDGWTELARISGNTDRRRCHRLGAAVVADAVRILVTATNGDPSARIFEVRLY